MESLSEVSNRMAITALFGPLRDRKGIILWIQTLYKQYYNYSLYITPLQSRNVVSAYLSSEQVLPLALHDSIAPLKDLRTCFCTNLLS